MAKRAPDLIDKRLLKALEHPTRVLILSILSEGPSSSTRIARRIENVSRRIVSHHMKVLKDLGCVELVDEVPRGVGVERIYRATKRQFFSDEEWAAFDPENRTPVSAAMLRRVSAETAEALESGTFDERPDNHLSRSPLEVDEQGWADTVALLAQTLNRLFEIHDESAKRATASGEALMTMRVVMMQYLINRDSPYDDEASTKDVGPPPP